jgi:ribosome-associated protein
MSGPDVAADGKSKSQRKREATALQALGERLVSLRPDQLARVPLDEDLREAVIAAQRITARGGRRRQLQLVGKLMRRADAVAISGALAALTAPRRRETARLHTLERWRARLVDEGETALDDLCTRYPGADRSALLALLSAAHGGAQGARALFRYLGDLIPDAEPASTPAQPTGDDAGGTEQP